MLTVPGFASMVVSGLVNLKFSAIAERMADMPRGNERGVPPPKYTVPISGISVSRHLVSISLILR